MEGADDPSARSLCGFPSLAPTSKPAFLQVRYEMRYCFPDEKFFRRTRRPFRRITERTGEERAKRESLAQAQARAIRHSRHLPYIHAVNLETRSVSRPRAASPVAMYIPATRARRRVDRPRHLTRSRRTGIIRWSSTHSVIDRIWRRSSVPGPVASSDRRHPRRFSIGDCCALAEELIRGTASQRLCRADTKTGSSRSSAIHADSFRTRGGQTARGSPPGALFCSGHRHPGQPARDHHHDSRRGRSLFLHFCAPGNCRAAYAPRACDWRIVIMEGARPEYTLHTRAPRNVVPGAPVWTP